VRCGFILVAIFSAVVSSACSSSSRADVVVAAASDTRDAFAEVAALLKSKDGTNVEFVFGSSGLLREQVLNGAPYDVFVSANLAFVDEVVVAGKALAETKASFAVGRLAVISAAGVAIPTTFRELGELGRVVIANPAHAPYGVAAREALASAGILEEVSERMILADNVADAVRIVRAGEASVGIVALSLVIGTPHLVVDESLHQPIRQSLVVTTYGADNQAAQRFVATLRSPEGIAILERYGFAVEQQ